LRMDVVAPNTADGERDEVAFAVRSNLSRSRLGDKDARRGQREQRDSRI